MAQVETRYNVVCISCGSVWEPPVRSPLWWQAKQRDESGKIDALPVTSKECGCVKQTRSPEAPFRVVGYDDLCSDFDMPFFSLVPAAKCYLELARDGAYIVTFVDMRAKNGRLTPLQIRLDELVRNSLYSGV